MSIKELFLKLARKTVLVLFDLFCFAFVDAAYFLACKFLDHQQMPGLGDFLINSLILLVFVFVLRFLFGVYFNLWRYTNTSTYLKLLISDGAASLLALTAVYFFGPYTGIWHLLTVSAFALLLAIASRLCYRQLYKQIHKPHQDKKKSIPVAILGAGQLGTLLAQELLFGKTYGSAYTPILFIDNDPAKEGSHVAGLKIYRDNEQILDLLKTKGVKELFIAIGGLDNETITEFYEFYSRAVSRVQIYELAMRDVENPNQGRRATLREFRIEDLLFRKALNINDVESFRYYREKCILVTGGGGSIGSELCRQIAKCKPSRLVIFDIYENNAYDIQQELIREYGDKLDLVVEIGSVRDRARLEAVFSVYRPDVVFHAAAHKHVPLMEHSGCEAIKNNVLGTFNTADMAEKYHVKKFILISTDKAVNPTNIMGATKRMCEMIIQCRTDSETNFAAVRFGNVLGSNGSVIPLFKRQIANGGPVTITDKRIIRYFMTIPEASQLVMQAGAMAKKGELFVLDMGRPVRIYDLAVNMIRLSGFEPGVDIQIEEIGLRPGEKLYEELLMKNETLAKTENDMIFIEKDAPLTRDEVAKKIDLLCDAVKQTEKDIASPQIKAALHRVVLTFRNPNKVNKAAEKAEEMQAVNKSQGEAENA